MPISKLKNLAILILLLANLVLLGVLLPRQADQRKQTQLLHTSLSSLCAGQNVVLSPDTLPDTVTLYPLELAEEEDAGNAAMTALADASGADTALPGGSWENGSISLKLQDQKEVSDLRGAAKKVLKRMGYEAYELSQPQRLSPGIYALTAKQSILGVPVFSEELTLTYSNSALSEISGSFFVGTLTKTDHNACISAAEAVVAFLSARVELGWVGSSITALEQGYIQADTAGNVRLTPVWKLSTDMGNFYVNGLTEEVLSAG